MNLGKPISPGTQVLALHRWDGEERHLACLSKVWCETSQGTIKKEIYAAVRMKRRSFYNSWSLCIDIDAGWVRLCVSSHSL